MAVSFIATMVLMGRQAEVPVLGTAHTGNADHMPMGSVVLETIRDNSDGLVYQPICGNVISLKEIGDGVFSEGIVGNGCGIEPEEGAVYAPFDGEVLMVADTKHAIGLMSADGTELIIHVGMDTVDMNGEGFDVKVKAGDKVKTGELLSRFDMEQIKKSGHPATTAVIVTNTPQFSEISQLVSGNGKPGRQMLQCKK